MLVEIVDPGILRFTDTLGARSVAFYCLDDGESCTLFDAGLPGSVIEHMDNGAISKPVSRIVLSHADADHLGDAAAVALRFPRAAILAHPLDRRWMEHHDLLVEERYCEPCTRYGFGRAQLDATSLRQLCGPDFVVTGALQDGEYLTAGSRTWEVLHVPGHTSGHVALWHPESGVLLFGDAVLGSAIPGIDGAPSMPATPRYIASYLTSVQRLRALPVRLALSGHWPPLTGAEFRMLADETLQRVERDLSAIGAACREQPRSFADLMQVLNDPSRVWPASEDVHYCFALMGYLEYLEAEGALRRDNEGRFQA